MSSQKVLNDKCGFEEEGYAVKNVEQIIKRRGREKFFEYYRSLGYDDRIAAVLALFTYGESYCKDLSLFDLFERVSSKEEDLHSEAGENRGLVKEFAIESTPEAYQNLVDTLFSEEDEGLADYIPERPSVNMSSSLLLDRLSEASLRLSTSMKREPLRLSSSMNDGSLRLSSLMNSGLARAGRSALTGSDLMHLAGAAGYATDEYENIEEKNERSTAAEPTSTFRMTTNTASAGVILNQLRNGRNISRSMVRIEELLNYFRYESELPREKMFHVTYELMDAENDRKYLYINVQGKEKVPERQNITILLDVSGSMTSKAEQTQAIIATILSKLGNGDKLSLVTYSSDDSVELEAYPINGSEDRIHVLEKLYSIRIGGATYGSAGIEKAYEIGRKNYIEGGNNQVILITDGDLNFGITSKGGLEELIERRKKDNLFLSVIGTGLFNYKDDKLEVLSKHGNGIYRTVNNLTDVKKSIDKEYASLVNIIAKDVKGQVEFNPEVVEAYRLLGFENRTLAHEDFTNDKVISEPFGSGGYGVALYELKMKTEGAPAQSTLKYSKLVTTGSSEPGTIKVRYKEPLEDVSHEIEKVIETAEASYTDNLRLAFIVYVCAEKLRGSDKISGKEIDLARKLYSELGSGIREKNSADLFKLAGILDKSEKELGVGLPEDKPFPW